MDEGIDEGRISSGDATLATLASGTEWTITALDTGTSLLDKSMLTYTVGFGEVVRIPRVIWLLQGPSTVIVDASCVVKIFRKVYMARFARTLGTLLSSGIPMLEAIRIVKEAIGNVHVAATLENSMAEVKGGKALSSTLEGQETFIRLVPQMVKIGEQSGAIDSMLDRVATYYENEVDEDFLLVGDRPRDRKEVQQPAL